jgi:sugar fermentation stimulation protein A
MKLSEGSLIKGHFIQRENLFKAIVEVDGKPTGCYLPNTGSLAHLLSPETSVFLAPKRTIRRKTAYDLVLVEVNSLLVCVDARVPNKLVYQALKLDQLPEFLGYKEIYPEYKFGLSQFDFLLEKEDQKCLLEVKSCTLVQNSQALFPDRPTKRGQLQVQDLVKAFNKGWRAAFLVIVQREDADCFAPNQAIDPHFSCLLEKAKEQGVEIYAYNCRVTRNSITLHQKIKVF